MQKSSVRRKRQIEGRRHTHRVDVYLSRQEKEDLRKAAQQSEMSVSQFAVLAIKNAVLGLRKNVPADFEPVDIRGEALSATVLRERR